MSIQGETSEIIKRYFKNSQLMSLSGVGHWHPVGEELCTPEVPYRIFEGPNGEMLRAPVIVEECFGHNPLELLEQELHNALEHVVYMKMHVDHTPFYDENGFCTLCGWDGNA